MTTIDVRPRSRGVSYQELLDRDSRAVPETLRIESALVFIGYDYFQGETSPFDVGLDKVVRLDTGDFCGKAALAAETADPPNRFVTLVVDDSVPEYGAAVTKDGEQVAS